MKVLTIELVFDDVEQYKDTNTLEEAVDTLLANIVDAVEKAGYTGFMGLAKVEEG